MRHGYGTPLLPPGDCFVAVVSTLRCIVCFHCYMRCSWIHIVTSWVNVMVSCALIIKVDAVGIILCIHIVIW